MQTLMGSDPLVFVGDYSPSYTPGAQRGGGIPYKSMTDALCRRGVCLEVDEPFSSQLSPTNSAPVRLAEPADIDGRPVRRHNRLFVIDGTRTAGGHKLMLDR